MTKIQYISLILLLILLASLGNLFYKPWWHDIQKEWPSVFGAPSMAPVTVSAGSLYGVKCDDPYRCDCKALGADLEPFDVMGGEAIYVMNRQLSAGRYCLPKGVSHCDHHTSFQMFTSSGWRCVARVASATLCHSKDARDNSRNVLWDHLENRKADKVVHLYEKLANSGTWRYQCKCGSGDMFQRPMVRSTPWTCSVDYCIADMLHVTVGMGWNGSICECGLAPRANPNDLTSPCKLEVSEVNDRHQFRGRVDCTSSISMVKRAIHCPPGEGVLVTEPTTIMSKDRVEHFLDEYLK